MDTVDACSAACGDLCRRANGSVDLKQVPRPRDFELAAVSLSELIRTAARWTSPDYTAIAEVARRLCRAGSAGVTLRESHPDDGQVRWLGIAGQVSLEVGGTAAANCVPCGVALASGRPFHITNPACHFSGLSGIEPRVSEALCVPFELHGQYGGTIWVISHRDDARLDSGDVESLETLGAFTSTILLKDQAREAREHAEANQRTLEALMENIPEGITIATGPDVLITHVSRYGLELTGRPAQEISGIAAPLHPERWQIYYPDGRPVTVEELPLTRASRSGETIRNEELVMRRPDGTERTILCNAGPIRKADLTISGGLIAWRDIDELKRAQSALKVSEEMFRTLAESLPVQLFIADLTGQSTYVNRRMHEFTGAPPGALLGSGWADYIHPDDLPHVRAAWDAAVAAADSYEVEHRFRRADGTYRWFLTRGQRFKGPDGIPIGWCGAAIDIDEARRAQGALRDANESKDAFLALLAHELRNPLAPIRNAAQILQLERVDAEAVAKCSGVIGRQVAIMARLLDDLLDVSRVTRGKLELRRESVQLWGALGQAVETSRPLVDAHGHELVVRLPQDPVRMWVDPVRLTQIISNLLNNASKFTPDGGRIELSADATDAGVSIRVTDNGVGLEPGATGRIFGMFTQAGRPASEGEGGLGIGLALAKALVELHGGRIEARSDGPGRGSVFEIWLPRITRELAMPVVPAQRTGGRTRRVLVVDDNADIVETLVMLLRLEGHEVRGAGSGPEALAVAWEFQPEFVLLDIGMPSMDGYDVARRMRQQPGLERAKLVAVTGWGTPGDKNRASAAGFDLHMTKPVNLDELLPLIGSVEQDRSGLQ